MINFAKAAALIALVLAAGAIPTAVAAQTAKSAKSTCTGTLCDLLHIEETQSAAKWAEERAAQTPKEPMPASGCFGTICDMLNVTSTNQTALEWVKEQAAKRPKEQDTGRCSGTVCDLYYSGSPAPAPAASQQAAVAPAAQPVAATRKTQRTKHAATKAAAPAD